MSTLFSGVGRALAGALRGGAAVAGAGEAASVASRFKMLPLLDKAGGAMVGASVGKDLLLDPIFGAVEGAVKGGERQDAAMESIRREQSQQIAGRLRLQRLRQDMAENTARLARYNPELYNQLAYGPMPAGSTMIGAEPDFDVVDQVAALMSRGRM